MQIKSILDYDGKQYPLEYEDLNSFSELPLEYCRQIYGVCFLNNGMIIVKNGLKNTWSLPGGTIEQGESIDSAFKREIQEETNLKITNWKPIGYQKIIYPDGTFIYQLRACALA